MSKVVKIVAIVAIAVAVIVFAPQIAGALAGLAPGVAATTISAATMATITSAVVGVGISLALSAASMLFTKAPKALSESMADRLQSTVVPTAPRKIVFGTTAAGNDIRFFETHGSKRDANAQVIALASHRLNAIKAFYLENEVVWQDGSLISHTDGINSFRAVTEGSPANAQAVGSGTLWTNSASFSGCAYIAVDWKLDNAAWPQGIPSRRTTIVEGCPVYDPRLDSTRGGSGSHRIDNQSTWEFRHGGIEIGRNPALCLLTYMIGWRYAGALMWGMGVPASRFNFDNFRTYANVCEEQVQLIGGGTVQRYSCDGIFSTSDAHEGVITAISAAMGSCKLTDVAGLYQFVGGYDDTLGPTQALNESDLIGMPGAPTPYSWIPAGPSRETCNIVRGRFADPAQQYQVVDWGVVETDPLADGVPRTLTLELGCVSRAETAQRIAKQFLLREALAPGHFKATFGPRAFALQVGSLVKLSLAPQGWNNKLFRVIEQTEVHDMIYQMTLREESPLIYAWDKEEKPLPPNIRPGGYDASFTVTPTGMSLSSVTYESVA